MLLHEIAFARSGEKGDDVFVAVIARDEADYERVRRTATVEAVTAVFAPIVSGSVERFELPRIGALNFALHGALDGGRSRNLAFDESGKALASRVLMLEVAE
jgi:hypothetical protein